MISSTAPRERLSLGTRNIKTFGQRVNNSPFVHVILPLRCG